MSIRDLNFRDLLHWAWDRDNASYRLGRELDDDQRLAKARSTLTPPVLVDNPKLVIETKRPAPYLIGVYQDRNGHRYKTWPMYRPKNWDDFEMWAYLSGNIVLYRIRVRPKAK